MTHQKTKNHRRPRRARRTSAPALAHMEPPARFEPLESRLLLSATFTQEEGPGAGDGGFADFNNDGWVDFLTGASVSYNQGGSFGGLNPLPNNSNGPATAGDFDNDGFIDIYSYGDHMLFRNVNGTSFEDVSHMLPAIPNPNSRGAAFADFNGDGFVDLYVGGFELWPSAYYPDTLLINDGGTGFSLAWTQSNDAQVTGGRPRPARGVSTADFDQDGDIDIYSSNYRIEPNGLWLNDGNGNITDVASARGATGGFGHTIGSAWGDMDEDGYLDLFVGNFSHPGQPAAQFLRNTGPGGGYSFQNMQELDGGDWMESYASPTLGDYDNDGDLDLFITTVYSGDQSRLYRNDGNWNFTFASGESNLPTGNHVYQAAWGDVDNDGDLDLIHGASLFRNNGNTGAPNHYLKVKLIGNGTSVNRAALGAQVRATVNGKTITRQVSGATGEGNFNDLTLHLGLGSFSGMVPLEITWTDGTVTTTQAAADTYVEISMEPPVPSDPDAIDFSSFNFVSYAGGQDAGGTATVQGGGSSLHLSGNTWKAIDYAYDIAPDTLLSFDFNSTAEAEVHGIGVDTDLILGGATVFQVHGTQVYGNQDFNDYVSGSGARSYVTPIGQYLTGQVDHLVFVNDDDGLFTNRGSGTFTNVKLFEPSGGEPPGGEPPAGLLNFAATPILAYSGQDADGTASVQAGGASLEIQGNAWKKIAFDYTLTADTVLEFDFSSSTQAEVHAIGFDTDNVPGSLAAFQLDGSQTWENQDYHTYAAGSGTQHYRLPVGQYMTGNVTHLFFVNDDDLFPRNGNSTYTNVRVYEDNDSTNHPPDEGDVKTDRIDFGAVDLQLYGGAGQTTTGTATAVSGGTGLRLVDNTWRKIDLEYTVTADTILEFDFESSSQAEVHAIGLDIDNTLANPASFQLYGTQTFENQDFRNYNASSGVKHYQIPVGQYITGDVKYLVFANDHDQGTGSQGTFTNVRVHEGQDLVPGAPINFNFATLNDFGGQTTFTGVASVQDDGATLHLSGNIWRRMDFPYTVTADTVLEFDFSSPTQAEVHSIGLDADLSLGGPGSFQLYGTQIWQVQDYRNYAATAPGSKHYAIPIGQYLTGDVQALFFGNDHDSAPQSGVGIFSNVRVHESELPDPGSDPVNFNLVTLSNYAGQTGANGSYTVEDNGASLHLSGNIWQRMDFPYTVTPDTVLEFDFESSAQGEVHAIGLDADQALGGPGALQLYGTQTWQVQDYRNYDPPGSKHYAIPIGQYLTGDVQYMFFGNDHDIPPQNGQSIFTNVTIHEGGLITSGAAPIDFRNHTVSGYGGAQQTTNGTATVVDDGNGLNLSGNGWQKIDFAYTILPDTVLGFEFESSTQGEVHAIGLDADNGAGSAASFQLYGTQTSWVQDFRDYATAALGKKRYSIPVGQYLTGDVQYLTFVNDHDAPPYDAVGIYSNIVIYEPLPLPPDVVDFAAAAVGNYGGDLQTTNGQATAEQGGLNLRLTGNTWKQIDFPYIVTPGTILDFDFAGSSLGEIQGIGFDDDLMLDSARFFSLDGVHNWGPGDVETYTGSGALQHYHIPVGQYFTGAVNHLVFANDDDVTGSTAESLFSAVRIFEGNSYLVPDAFTVDEDSGTTNFDVLSNDNLAGLSITSVTQGSGGGTVAIAGGGLSVDYAPAANFFGTETFTYAAQTVNPGESGVTTVSMTVNPTNDPPDAVDDDLTVSYSPGAVSLNVLANDLQAPDSGETLSIVNVSQGTLGGTVAIAGGGSSIDYTPVGVGTETFTYRLDDGTPGSEDTATVTITTEATTLNLNNHPILSYGGAQDGTGAGTVTNGGATLQLNGNTWKAIAYDYTITPDTVLEFDFQSSVQGEVHTIGFDDNLQYSIGFSFQVHGTQTAGYQDFNDYVPSATTHYVIPVGQYETGSYSHILFGNDDDNPPQDSQGSFRNISIYDPVTPDPLVLDSHAVHGEGAARSRVTEVMLTFSNEIAQLDPAAVAMVAAGGGSMPVDIEDTGDATTYRVSFNGSGYEHGSLPDGQYTLTVDGSQIQDIHGQALDGADPVIQFHRLFGDFNGDDDVDADDQNAFLAAFGTQTGDAGYGAQYDYDGDGHINAVDQIEIGDRMGQTSADAPPPVIHDPSVVVNDGHRQRSRVTNIAVGFDRAVNDPTAALVLERTDGPGGTVALTVQPGADGSTFVLSFSGALSDGYGSLVDGVYQLKIDMGLVIDPATGQPLGAGVVTHDLHRLFGDFTGDGHMDRADLTFVRTSFGRSSSAALYVNALDEDDNGIIDIFDMLKLRDRMGMAMSI